MHPNVVLNYTRSDGVSVQASDRAIRWVSKALGPLQSIDFRTTRKWGFSVSTFALRSNESLGIGDLDDLRKCMDTLGQMGAEFCTISPLGLWSSRSPYEHYPYAPGSRILIDPVHVSMASAGIISTGPAPSSWKEARRRKIALIRRLVTENPLILRQDEFRKWAAEATTRAQREALFALERKSRSIEPHYDELSSMTDDELLGADLGPYWWTQYEAERQLKIARMVMPVYGDLPVGVASPGLDAEMWPHSILTGANLGAPSDADHVKPQVWAVHGWDPRGLARCGYVPYRQTLETNLKFYSGLRVDHALALGRQYIVPIAGDTFEGVYVRSDTSALTEILVSHVSPDGTPYLYLELIGTPFDELEAFVSYHGLPRYRLLLADLDQRIDRKDLVALTNHDTPTLKGLWTRCDLAMQHSLGFHGDDAALNQLLERTREYVGGSACFSEYQNALYERLSGCAADRVTAHLEDMLGMEYRLHYPGHAKGPDYQAPHPRTIEQWRSDGRVQELCEILSTKRGM